MPDYSRNRTGQAAASISLRLTLGPGAQPPVPVADILTERTRRLDVVEWFHPGEQLESEARSLRSYFWGPKYP